MVENDLLFTSLSIFAYSWQQSYTQILKNTSRQSIKVLKLLNLLTEENVFTAYF